MFVPNPKTIKLSFRTSYTYCWIMMTIYIYIYTFDIITLRKDLHLCGPYESPNS